MSLAMQMPFVPGDWVRHKLFLHVARVVECCARAEAPDGVFCMVRYMDDHRAGVVAGDFEPCAPPRPVLRLVHSDLRRPFSPARVAGSAVSAPPAVGPVEFTDYSRICETIIRHTEAGSDYHD